MTNFAVTKGGTLKSPPRSDVRVPFVSENIINFAAATVPNSGPYNYTVTTPLSGNAAGDTVQAINVPAGFIVILAGYEVIVADTAGNSGTIQITDGTNTYTSAAAPSSVGFKAFTTAANRLYTTAGVLSFAVATGNINAVVRMYAVMIDANGVDSLYPG